jgi:hypothetical protein
MATTIAGESRRVHTVDAAEALRGQHPLWIAFDDDASVLHQDQPVALSRSKVQIV